MKPCLLPHWHKNYTLILLLLMLLVAFAAVNIGTVLLSGSRQLDLTSAQRYTLHEQTLSWLKQNTRTILIRLYLSPEIGRSYPGLEQYSRYLVKFLEQYQNHSGGKISLETIETVPYEAAEKDAQRFGIRGFLDKSGSSSLYFGAVFSDELGNSGTIPYFDPRRSAYLEHDVSRILSKLDNGPAPEIGIISPLLPVMSSADKLDSVSEWPFITALKNDYQVTLLRPDTAQIPLQIRTLLVFNPQNLAPMSIYALDQYLLRGGSLILLLDPFSEAFLNLNGHIAPSFSNLYDFLKSKGLSYSDTRVIGDAGLAAPALLQNSGGSAIRNYPLWLDLNASVMSQKSGLTAGLQKLTFKSAGGVELEPAAAGNILISTTGQAGTVPADTAMYNTKAEIKDAFSGDNRTYVLAALLEGNFRSLYSAHPLAGTDYVQKMFPFLSASVKPGKLLVVADSDFLFSPEWNAAPAAAGQGPYDFIPFNNNYDFIERAIDELSGNTGLLGITPQSGFDRKPSISAGLRRSAEQNYLEEYTLYNSAAAQADFELSKLLQQLENNQLLSTAATDRRIEELTRRRDENRSRLKEVEFKINRRVQNAQNRIIWLNLAAWPAGLIGIIWLINQWREYRNRRRAKEYTHE